MALLLEIFLSGVRIVFLFTGSLLAFVFGFTFYNDANTFLLAHNLPTLELIALLVAFVPVIALLYGVHIRKYFWRRSKRYNLIVFLFSFLAGLLIALFPLSTCGVPIPISSQVIIALTTGIITSLLAYIGLDVGVVVKHISVHVLSEKKKKVTVKIRKKK